MDDFTEMAKTLGLPAAFAATLLVMLGGLMLALVRSHNRFLLSISGAVNKIAEALLETQKSIESSNRRADIATSQRDAQHQLVMAKLEELRRTGQRHKDEE